MEAENRSQSVRFSAVHAAMFVLALAVSLFYFFGHLRLFSGRSPHFPGIGLMLSQWALLFMSVFCAALEKRLVRKWPAVALGVLALLLGLCYGLYADDWLRLMNLPVLYVLTWLASGALTGHADASALFGVGLEEAFFNFFHALLAHIPIPFRALASLRLSRRRHWRDIGIGLVICVPVLAAALLLLASADEVFGGMMDSLAVSIQHFDAGALVNLVLALAFSLPLFSLLYASAQPRRILKKKARPAIAPPVFAVTLAALAILYAVFGYVQIRVLFSGSETALLHDGYAQYARSGFFQLVAVAFLTLLVVLSALKLCAGSKGIRVLCGAVAVLTLLITYSAFYRMSLYIGAYGLSLLRLLTLWAILMIFLTLLTVMAKSIWPALRIRAALCVVILGSWVMLNLSNPDLRIAQYNVRACNAGTLEKLDISYLIHLSPGVLPALEEIEDEAQRESALELAMKEWNRVFPSAYDWGLAWRHAPLSK